MALEDFHKGFYAFSVSYYSDNYIVQTLDQNDDFSKDTFQYKFNNPVAQDVWIGMDLKNKRKYMKTSSCKSDYSDYYYYA